MRGTFAFLRLQVDHIVDYLKKVWLWLENKVAGLANVSIFGKKPFAGLASAMKGGSIVAAANKARNEALAAGATPAQAEAKARQAAKQQAIGPGSMWSKTQAAQDWQAVCGSDWWNGGNPGLMPAFGQQFQQQRQALGASPLAMVAAIAEASVQPEPW